MTQAVLTSPSPRAARAVVSFHERVAGLCKDRLREALNPATALFDRQLRDRTWQATRDTEDLTSTAICLIGLHRAEVAPRVIGLDVRRTLSALVEVTRRRRYQGGLGLVLWANAVWDGLPLDELLRKTGMALAPGRELTASLTTMETAWLVSGLVHEHRRSRSPRAEAALEVATRALLERYQPDTRLFRHAGDEASVAHRLRKWVSNFADQIYSVQATAFVAITRGRREALAASEACAARLVELQGELGQWWWHYDPRDGRVAQGFPVYSVHQHAMAPMALMTLAAAGGADHRAAVELSHAWLGRNELGAQLLDREAGTLWRDIELVESRLARTARHAIRVVGWKPPDVGLHETNLKVNFETRPYEWAWCLFAGAIAAGSTRPQHVI